MDGLVQRLKRLERENQRQRMVAIALDFAIVNCFSYGLAAEEFLAWPTL